MKFHQPHVLSRKFSSDFELGSYWPLGFKRTLEINCWFPKVNTFFTTLSFRALSPRLRKSFRGVLTVLNEDVQKKLPGLVAFCCSILLFGLQKFTAIARGRSLETRVENPARTGRLDPEERRAGNRRRTSCRHECRRSCFRSIH